MAKSSEQCLVPVEVQGLRSLRTVQLLKFKNANQNQLKG